MTYYERLKRKRLSDILIVEGVATKEAVIAALQEHQRAGHLLSHVLVSNGELQEYDLARILVEQYQLPFLELMHYSYHRDLIQRFPASLLHQARMVPLDSFGEVTCFVCQEFPPDNVFEQLAEHGAHKLFLYAALATDIRNALTAHVPLGDGALPPPAPASPEEPVVDGAAMSEDTAWKELFDTANEAIVSEASHKVEPASPQPPDDPDDEDVGAGVMPDVLNQD